MAETGPDGTSHGLGLFPTLRETDIARMRRDLLAAMPAAGEHVQSYAIAQDVIITFLGIGWWQENLTSSGDAGGYLQNQPTSEMASLQNHHRVLELGRMIFFLQHSPGFSDIIEGLKTRDLAAAVAEMQVAKLMIRNGRQVRFRKATGVKGEDYDLQVGFDNHWLHTCQVPIKLPTQCHE